MPSCYMIAAQLLKKWFSSDGALGLLSQDGSEGNRQGWDDVTLPFISSPDKTVTILRDTASVWTRQTGPF